MFQSDMTEAATKVVLKICKNLLKIPIQRVDIQDLQPDTVNDMLLYIYTGNPQVFIHTKLYIFAVETLMLVIPSDPNELAPINISNFLELGSWSRRFACSCGQISTGAAEGGLHTPPYLLICCLLIDCLIE